MGLFITEAAMQAEEDADAMKNPPATATKSETMTLNALLRAITDTARRAEDAFYNGGEAELTEEVEHVMTLAQSLTPHLDELRGTSRPACSTCGPNVVLPCPLHSDLSA